MKKCKECGREETGYGSLLDEDGYCFNCGVKYSKEKIKRLQEQLSEANELLNLYFPKKLINSVCVKPINDYKTKWGVK